MRTDVVAYNGWKNNVRLTNNELEIIVTKDVGPRIIRFGFQGERNVFAEIPGQQGGMFESEWKIRGGHRLWIAPEEKPRTYELDNSPIRIEKTRNGIRTIQAVGPLTGILKTMEIRMTPKRNGVTILHTLANKGRRTVRVAPWALTVMAPKGTAIIPLPKKIPHTKCLEYNQQWSIWAYTDFSDPRWEFGSRYVLFHQDPKRGPNKVGIAHREGWVGYLLDTYLFVKRFSWIRGAAYPDGGVNFETFSNQDFLELESLGPLVDLAPGRSASHEERWSLYRNVPRCRSEADRDRMVRKLVRQAGH